MYLCRTATTQGRRHFITNLQMRKWRLREVMRLVQRHTASEGPSGLGPGILSLLGRQREAGCRDHGGGGPWRVFCPSPAPRQVSRWPARRCRSGLVARDASLPGPSFHLPVPGDDSNATVTEKGFTLCACFHFSQTTKVFPGIWVQLQAAGTAGGGGGGREKAKAEASQLHGGCARSGVVPSPCGVAAAKAARRRE